MEFPHCPIPHFTLKTGATPEKAASEPGHLGFPQPFYCSLVENSIARLLLALSMFLMMPIKISFIVKNINPRKNGVLGTLCIAPK